jgi:hypothetical protein
MYSKLPLDIIYHILSYTGIVKLRNGKYIYQISKTDVRYKILDSIPKHKVCKISNRYVMYVMLKITSNHSKCINIAFEFENNKIEYSYLHLVHANADNKHYIKYISNIYF